MNIQQQLAFCVAPADTLPDRSPRGKICDASRRLFVTVPAMKRVLKAVLFLLAGLGALLAIGLLSTWAPDQPVSALVGRWAQPPSQFVPVAGLQVHLRDEGPKSDPVPIVLLHGTSSSLHTWDGWAAALKEKRRVIRFDLPGFALTGPKADHDYTIGAYVRFVIAMLDSLAVQRVVIAGNSLGGYIAWSTAHDHPDRVERLILVDSSGYPPKPQSVPIGFRIASTPGLNRLMRSTLPRSLVESSVRNVFGDPSKVTPELVDRYRDMTLREGNRRAIVHRLQQGYTGNPAHIQAIRQPTLILWGGRDRLVPPEHGERFARDIAGSKHVVFEDLGHVPQEEDPARTVAALRDFLGL
jgi:pimeloyl-ACP methyl ester carboxylesterase